MTEIPSNWWDQIDPGFFSPLWLYVIPFVVVALGLLEWGTARFRRKALQLFVAPHLLKSLTQGISSSKRLAKSLLFITAMVLVFIALSRPHFFYEWREEIHSGTDILLAVDCSRSMLTQDVRPSRLERAKLAIADLSDNLPGCRLGLIAFAGDAFLECPLTLDHEAFQNSLQDLDTNIISRPGTDIASAIEQAEDALSKQTSSAKIVVLVTDGEDLEGRVLDAARKAAGEGLKIYTIGVGTPAGDKIPVQDELGNQSYLKYQDAPVVSKLDEDKLKEIARLSGGAYAPLGQRGEGLEYIYQNYLSGLKKETQENTRRKIPWEQFMWPLSFAIILLIMEFLLTDRVNSRFMPQLRKIKTTTALALMGFFFVLAPLSAAPTSHDEDAYLSGHYDDATEGYKKAVDENPDQPEWQYDLGDSAYKAHDYHLAENAFRKSLHTPDLNLQQKAYHNLGNTQFKRGEELLKTDQNRTITAWQEALSSYESALKLKELPDTRHNYEYVKRRLEELKEQKKQQQQQQQQKNGSSQPQNGDPSQGNNPQDSSGNSRNQGQSGQNPDQGNPSQSSPGTPSQDGKPNSSGQQQDNQGQSQDNKQQQNGASQGKKIVDANTAHSQQREQDMQDAGSKSREEAIELLDSLKGEEYRLNSRSYNNQQQPPPPSGKDW